MANLITGIDWSDHGLISRREPSELSEEDGDGDSSDVEGPDESREPRD